MEVAAVGLAGNIVQFVLFGCNLVSTTISTLKSVDGLSTHNGDLYQIAEDLEHHSANLKEKVYCDSKLVELATRSQAAAEELLDAVNDVRLVQKPGERRLIAGFRKALKGVWSKEKIESLSTKLDKLRDAIVLHLTVQTRDTQTKIQEFMSYNHKETIQKIHELSQKFTTSMKRYESASQKALAGEISSYDLHKAFSDFFTRFENSAQMSSILTTLQSQSMGTRYEQIHEAHKETYEWVFKANELPESDPRSKITYSSWLADGQGIYWVTGKPGSGKSTLMKFLQSHTETARSLEIWTGPSRLVRASFYFWNAGTSMQKSLQGLLRSLLSTILKESPDLIKVLCRERWGDGHIFTEKSKPWTVQELKACFDRIVNLDTLSTRFYFHIDGLDEYDGDHNEVINIVRQLSRCPMIKLCVSSRPWNCFHETIGKDNAGVIYLHELTQKDIHNFVEESIISYTGDRYNTDHEQLVKDITERAEGIFLWVRLVVKSLQHGIENDDQLSLLQERLNQLPADLEELFVVILTSVDPVYQKRMAYALLNAIYRSYAYNMRSILHYSFIDDYEDNPNFAMELAFNPMSSEEISRRVTQTLRRLNGRYKGLLEPCNIGHDSVGPSTPVQLLHRTLRDFLNTNKMQCFLKEQLSPNESITPVILSALLAAWKAKPECPIAYTFRMARALTKERDDPTTQFSIYDHIEDMYNSYGMTSSLGSRQVVLDYSIRFLELDYIEYRIRSGKIRSLDDLLFHGYVCSTTAMLASKDEHGDHSFTMSLDKENPLIYSRGGRPWFMRVSPQTHFMKLVLDRGANPNAIVRGIRIWETFLREGLLTLMSYYKEGWWGMFHQMVIHGANVKDNTRIWIDILRYGQTVAGEEVLSIIKAFSLLLQYGLEPNARSEKHTIWQEALKLLFWTKDVSDIELVKDLLRAFLRQGADVTAIFHASVTSHYNRSFLEEISHAMQEQEIMLGGLCPLEVFEIFLGHGLDPNFVINGTSLWEIILNSIHEKLEDSVDRTPERLHRIKDCLVTFLRYGADPSIDILQNLVGGHSQSQCAFSRADARELERVMKKETEYRKSQDMSTHLTQSRRLAYRHKRGGSSASANPSRKRRLR